MKRFILPSFFVIGLILLGAGAATAQSTSIAGEWDASYNTPGGPRSFRLIFNVEGEKVTGTAKRSNGDVPLTGTVKGDDISFSYTINYNGNDLTLSFSGKIKGDSMDGTVAFNENANEEWSAKRVPTPKPSMRKAEK
ncbi:MAG TPA: hypothetical protein PLP07_14905 [Pyrinomonadaceae bacterium]|nr:hypothetical protein [Chloracidobacterium sp.]MBP9934411.1 hypothetical protein [Pyrinomonadaceae bacterium]MBK7802610.1 hypothetical protein [Chloracidobacterium sp.]MBK9437461.1 hypothetical protein [Chloracidobacterium sp.]MBL0240131.1 hypothetical protein [Chloracidobacterium sp.]